MFLASHHSACATALSKGSWIASYEILSQLRTLTLASSRVKALLRWHIAHAHVQVRLAHEHERHSGRHVDYGMTSMRAAPMQTRGASALTTPREHAARFECLNWGFGVGTGNGVLSRAELKISARVLRCAVLRVQAVPTNPLMPNLAQFGRSGAQKQVYKGLGCQEWMANNQLGKPHPLDIEHAL